MDHNHPHDGLVFACPACRAVVEADQYAAEVAAAPLRRCMVSWRALGRGYAGPAQLRVPPGWPPRDVFEFHRGRLDRWLDRQVTKQFPSGKTLTAAINDAQITKISVGVLVIPVPVPATDQPSLFE